MEALSGNTPRTLTRPNVGFNPTTPQNDAGIRIEPPVSVPVANGTIPAATAAADPPLDPPGMRSRSHGLWIAPKCGLFDVAPYASSCSPVLPTSTAPASSSLAAITASRVGT